MIGRKETQARTHKTGGIMYAMPATQTRLIEAVGNDCDSDRVMDAGIVRNLL